MLVLPQKAAVWRQTDDGTGGRNESQVIKTVDCLVVPVSRFDRQSPYALEATHVLWVPGWLTLFKEDEVRYGRYATLYGDIEPYVYVVVGRREFRFGQQGRAYYTTERQ